MTAKQITALRDALAAAEVQVDTLRKLLASVTGDSDPSAKRSPAPAKGMDSWMTPYAEEWKAVYDGVMPCARFAKALRVLERDYGPAEVLVRWGRMLRQNKAQFATPDLLARAWGEYASDGSMTARHADVARRLFSVVTSAGLATCPPEELATRIQALEVERKIKDAGTLSGLLKTTGLSVFSEPERFAIPKITALLSAGAGH